MANAWDEQDDLGERQRSLQDASDELRNDDPRAAVRFRAEASSLRHARKRGAAALLGVGDPPASGRQAHGVRFLGALRGRGAVLAASEIAVTYAMDVFETPGGRTASGEIEGEAGALRAGQVVRLRLEDGVIVSVTLLEVSKAAASFETREPLHGRS